MRGGQEMGYNRSLSISSYGCSCCDILRRSRLVIRYFTSLTCLSRSSIRQVSESQYVGIRLRCMDPVEDQCDNASFCRIWERLVDELPHSFYLQLALYC